MRSQCVSQNPQKERRANLGPRTPPANFVAADSGAKMSANITPYAPGTMIRKSSLIPSSKSEKDFAMTWRARR